jgi:hypothetical protein
MILVADGLVLRSLLSVLNECTVLCCYIMVLGMFEWSYMNYARAAFYMRSCFSVAVNSLVDMINKSVSASKNYEASTLIRLGFYLFKMERLDETLLSCIGTFKVDPFRGGLGASIDFPGD